MRVRPYFDCFSFAASEIAYRWGSNFGDALTLLRRLLQGIGRMEMSGQVNTGVFMFCCVARWLPFRLLKGWVAGERVSRNNGRRFYSSLCPSFQHPRNNPSGLRQHPHEPAATLKLSRCDRVLPLPVAGNSIGQSNSILLILCCTLFFKCAK